MSVWSNASVTIGAPRRGGGKQEPWKFVCQSMSLTWSWGAQPASGTLTYVSNKAYPPIVYDAAMEVECFGKQFWGVCRSGPLIQVNEDGTAESLATLLSSGGHELQLGFMDCRYYLNKDIVFCAYNLPDKRIAVGASGMPGRVRRYKHLRPWHARLNYWTYSLQPLSAAEIIREIMSYNVANTTFAKEATIGSVWSGQFHPDMERFPVFNIEARDGRTLDDVLVEISEKLGLMFTLMGGPFNLAWARRGEGGSATGQMLPPPPEKCDDRVLRVEMTDHPTRLFVVGDRNIYVKLDLPLTPDWNRAWEEVFDVDLLMQDLFDYETDPRTGQKYNAIPGDTENAQGYQMAAARAREITVREYAEIRAARDQTDFRDLRLFGGRSRMDLPAAIYIEQLLFRAFRPPPTVNLGGGQVPIEALEIVEDLPARITHDPVSGVMTAHLDNISGGNGYLITRGFRIGQEMFLVLQPERFDVDLFLKSTELWAPLTFQIDNSGETGRFIIVDEKVVKTNNLIAWSKTDGDWLNGYAVLNANPQFEIPEVRAALVFAGDRFYAPLTKQTESGEQGAGSLGQTRNNGRDGVVYESGLYRECIVHSLKVGTQLTEIPYADGELAWLKAIQIASPLLARPTWYWTGSQRWILRPGDQIPDLTGMIDRITLQQSDSGHECVMEFGGERVPRTKMLERDYDRLSRMRTVIPRQQELLNEARMLREIAAVFRTNPDIARRMMQETQRVLGANPMEGYARITVRGGTGRFAAGTPLRKASKQTTKDAETGALKSSNTWAVMPADATPADNQFVGVTVRHGENAAGNLRVQASGVALARVQGPVVAGDNLVLAKADGAAEPRDYLVKEDKGDTGAMAVGRAMESVPDGPSVDGGEVKLIKVWLGVGAGGKGGGYGVWA